MAGTSGKTTLLEVRNTYDNHSRLTSRTLNKGANWAGTTQAYTYLPPYGQLGRSIFKRNNVTESVVDVPVRGGGATLWRD